MSLPSLRNLRLQGQRPAHVVTVLIGNRPDWREDDASLVVIRETDQPALMDFRPLVGLGVVLVMTVDNYPLASKTLAAIEAVGVKLFGAALPCGAYPCLENSTPEHKRLLSATWNSLCQ